jgi:beta-aspartyl-peptidase (threonine type)
MKKTLLALGLGLALSATAMAAQDFRLVIHGGAGNIVEGRFTPEEEKAYHEGLQAALKAGYDVLAKGGTSVDAVKAAINQMELNPIFNAGRGAVFTNEGKNELDASIMDGKDLTAGAVAGVTNVKHPINCADLVRTKSPHVMMVTQGAEKFCAQNGAEIVDPKWFFTQHRYDQLKKAQEKEQIVLDHDGAKKTSNAELYIDPLMYDYKYGTVGAVALDKHGNLAAATSTGGMTNKRFGRVGDSPIVGAGTYANNQTVAVSATGSGEMFIRTSAAHNVHTLYKYVSQDVQKAGDAAIKEVGEIGGSGGLIILDAKGNYAFPMNSKGMHRGTIGPDGKPMTAMYGTEKLRHYSSK